jgi:hypothetical protein
MVKSMAVEAQAYRQEHHVIPSLSLVGVLVVAVQWEKSNFWGPRGMECRGKSTEIYEVLETYNN